MSHKIQESAFIIFVPERTLTDRGCGPYAKPRGLLADKRYTLLLHHFLVRDPIDLGSIQLVPKSFTMGSVSLRSLTYFLVQEHLQPLLVLISPSNFYCVYNNEFLLCRQRLLVA